MITRVISTTIKIETVEEIIGAPAVPASFDSEEAFAGWLNEQYGESEHRKWQAWSELPGDFYEFAIATSKPCDSEQVESLAGYFFSGPFAGEGSGSGWLPSTDRLFFLSADSTKSRRDDIGDALPELWEILRDGTPIRKTDRKGPGTKGTRAVEGLGCDLWIAFR